jgi:hypothetical protein
VARFNGSDSYLKPMDEIASDPVRGLAMRRTNLLPDVVTCDLPLDNRRSPGYRRIEPHMANNRFYMWIGQHETGRYAKVHKHGSAAVLICLKGKGYTYTWPSEVGTHPFSEGKRDQGYRVGYEPVGMVSAAPMSGNWFHQHFGIGKQPWRMSAWFGPNNARGRRPGRPGEKKKTSERSTFGTAATPSLTTRRTPSSERNLKRRNEGKVPCHGWKPGFTSRPRREKPVP